MRPAVRTRAVVLARAGLVLSGLALAVVGLELTLRLAGAFVLASRDLDNRQGLDGADAVVLCLGESTTQGRREASWPLELQRLLDEPPGHPRVKVVNLGLSGTNSRDIVARLPDDLARWRPSVVISMMGVNDYCLWPGDGEWTPTPPPPSWRPPDTPWRTLKLLHWLRQALRDPADDAAGRIAEKPARGPFERGDDGVSRHEPPTPGFRQAEALAAGGRVSEAERAFAALVNDEPLYLDAWLSWAHLLESAGRGAEATGLLERGLAIFDRSPRLRVELSARYSGQGRHASAAALLERASDLAPGDDVTKALLAHELRALGRSDEAGRVEAAVATLRGAHLNVASVRNYRRLAGLGPARRPPFRPRCRRAASWPGSSSGGRS